MTEKSRYQAAIVSNNQVLLIQHHYFQTGERWWILPGGGRMEGESEEECVAREIKEETGLDVRVERLLFERPTRNGKIYSSYKTYLCTPLAGEAKPGYEPEVEAARAYEIADVRWIDLHDQATWGEDLLTNPIMGPLLRSIQFELGYQS